MQIKFKNSLYDYDYLVMFDLASKNTGVCIWDIKKDAPLKVQMIKVLGKGDTFTKELYEKIEELFNNLLNQGIEKNKIVVAKEAMPVQLRGGSSTVQTFIALAKSHAILDFFIDKNEYNMYDYIGVYPSTTHAYFKRVMGWDSKHPVDKGDIKGYIVNNYNFNDITFDESDAVFLAQTLIHVKWDKDITEEIREVKKHKKELKMQNAIEKCDQEIARLENLKNNFEI